MMRDVGEEHRPSDFRVFFEDEGTVVLAKFDATTDARSVILRWRKQVWNDRMDRRFVQLAIELASISGGWAFDLRDQPELALADLDVLRQHEELVLVKPPAPEVSWRELPVDPSKRARFSTRPEK